MADDQKPKNQKEETAKKPSPDDEVAGKAYDEYVTEGTVHHMPAPSGMRLTDPFPEPLTPVIMTSSGR